MRVEDVFDLFPCRNCKNNYKLYVKTKSGRSGYVWNTCVIEDPETSLYLGDEWDEISDVEVEVVICPYCDSVLFDASENE